MGKRLIFVLGMLGFFSLHTKGGDDIRIGLFHNAKIQTLIFGIQSGNYSISLGNQSMEIAKGDLLKISRQSNNLVFEQNGNLVMKGVGVAQFRALSDSSSFKMLPLEPEKTERWFLGSLELVVRQGRILPINVLDIEWYLPGVVEAETGGSQNLEFYKVQTIISRTYAIRNVNRHNSEGFSVCDQVHCQVYHGISKSNPDIHLAARQTEGKVIVNSKLQLITAAFHSNCGGETVNSEHVWSNPVVNLRSVSDSFCIDQPHYNWKFKLAADEWEKYVEEKSEIELDSSLIFQFKQPRRAIRFLDEENGIPLKTIRRDWRLKSTFFDLDYTEDNVYFLGRGFGHGVGMCQEGAMQMARNLEPFHKIIHHYYNESFLVDLQWLPVLRENRTK